MITIARNSGSAIFNKETSLVVLKKCKHFLKIQGIVEICGPMEN